MLYVILQLIISIVKHFIAYADGLPYYTIQKISINCDVSHFELLNSYTMPSYAHSHAVNMAYFVWVSIYLAWASTYSVLFSTNIIGLLPFASSQSQILFKDIEGDGAGGGEVGIIAQDEEEEEEGSREESKQLELDEGGKEHGALLVLWTDVFLALGPKIRSTFASNFSRAETSGYI